MARILVVEDDETTRGIMEAHLKRVGHSVRLLDTGAEALAVTAERGMPDVAVLDIGLPDMDGFELLEQLRAQPGGEDLPVIFLTGRVDEAQVEAGRRAGAVYLTKPFVASALLGAIDRVLPDPGAW